MSALLAIIILVALFVGIAFLLWQAMKNGMANVALGLIPLETAVVFALVLVAGKALGVDLSDVLKDILTPQGGSDVA